MTRLTDAELARIVAHEDDLAATIFHPFPPIWRVELGRPGFAVLSDVHTLGGALELIRAYGAEDSLYGPRLCLLETTL